MRELIAFFEIACRAREHDIPGEVRATFTCQRNNMIGVKACPAALLIEFCFAIVALAALPFILLLNILLCEGALSAEPSCPPIACVFRMPTPCLSLVSTRFIYPLQSLPGAYFSSAWFAYPVQPIFFLAQSMEIIQCSRKGFTALRATLKTFRSIADKNSWGMRGAILVVLALFTRWIQFVQCLRMSSEKLFSGWKFFQTLRTNFVSRPTTLGCSRMSAHLRQASFTRSTQSIQVSAMGVKVFQCSRKDLQTRGAFLEAIRHFFGLGGMLFHVGGNLVFTTAFFTKIIKPVYSRFPFAEKLACVKKELFTCFALLAPILIEFRNRGNFCEGAHLAFRREAAHLCFIGVKELSSKRFPLFAAWTLLRRRARGIIHDPKPPLCLVGLVVFCAARGARLTPFSLAKARRRRSTISFFLDARKEEIV